MLLRDHIDPAGRFALRELTIADAAGLEHIDRALFYPYMRHVTGPRRFLAEAIAAQSGEPRMFYDMGIVLPDHRERLIGVVGAIGTAAGSDTAVHSLEIGYAVIPAFQRRGIARSALLAFLAAAVTPQMVDLTATVDPDNLPSIRLLEGCGFSRAGLLQTSKYLGDPDNPAHHEAGTLQFRPRVEYRAKAEAFRSRCWAARPTAE